MNPEIEQKLFAHLDSEQQQKQQAEVRATEAQRALEKNDADFKAKKDSTIRPALEELVSLYVKRGTALRIFETEEQRDHQGATHDATIGLDTRAAFPQSRGDMKPEFKLSFNRRSRKLSLYTTTPNTGNPGGDISLDDITADWIHEQFLGYVAPEQRKVQFGKIVG